MNKNDNAIQYLKEFAVFKSNRNENSRKRKRLFLSTNRFLPRFLVHSVHYDDISHLSFVFKIYRSIGQNKNTDFYIKLRFSSADGTKPTIFT